MKRIGIIGPSPEEIRPFMGKMQSVKREVHASLEVWLGDYAGHSLAVVTCGVGKVNAALAAQMLVDRYDLSWMMVVGVAGAIGPLAIGDTVIATETAHHDVDQKFLREEHPFLQDEMGYIPSDPQLIQTFRDLLALESDVFFGKMVTGEYFVDQKGREMIIEHYDPLAVDMETVAAAQCGLVNQIPFIAIRTITDTPQESGLENFRRNLLRARSRSLEVLERVLNEWPRSSWGKPNEIGGII